ncbi:MAG: ATP-binding protein, partial [Myxococcales bacterium]
DGRIVQSNPVVQTRLGYTAEELEGMHVLALHPAARRDEAGQIVLAMLAGEATACPVPLVAKDGTQIPVETRVTHGIWGGRPALFGISRDVTERTHAEAALRRRDDILEAVSFTAHAFLQSVSWENHIDEVLARLGHAAGASRVYIFQCQFAIERSAWLASQRYEWCATGIDPQMANPDLQDVDLQANGLGHWVSQLEGGGRIAGDVLQLPDADRIILEPQGIQSILVLPVFLGEQWWGFIGFDECRVERHWQPAEIDMLAAAADALSAAIARAHTVEALRKSEARSSVILDSFPDLIFLIDREGRITDFRASRQEDLYTPADQIRNSNLRQLLPPNVAALALDHLQWVLKTREVSTFEYTLPMPVAHQFHEARMVALGPNEVLCVVRNVSERKRLEQMKSDFINRAAHELRTPLATIMLMASLIEEGGTPEELKEYWRILNAELVRQRTLVEKLLVFGRMDAGLFELARIPVDMGEVSRGAWQTVAPLAQAKSITLSSCVAPDLPQVLGDKDYLWQVVLNLLTNAVKFTPVNGQVTLRVESDGGYGTGIVAQVTDTGLGIPPEDMSHLFERFFRASNAIEQEIQGTGMGLYMVKTIVEQLGGQVRVASTLGQGTSVTVWLPTIGGKDPIVV